MNSNIFGYMPDGTPVHEFHLKAGDLTASVLTLGGILHTFCDGEVDIVAGFDTLEDYLADTSYQGAIIGRTAGRIPHGRLTVDGKTYELERNEGGRCTLHGGFVGYNRRVWNVVQSQENGVILSLISPDGECGFPGEVTIHVGYLLTDKGLMVNYTATCSDMTALNVTQHAYFNLHGYGNGDVLDHTLKVNGDCITEVDAHLLPTGGHTAVDGTPYDLRTPVRLGDRIGGDFGGYDVNYVLNRAEVERGYSSYLTKAAVLSVPERTLTVFTDRPSVQIYTGNMLTGEPAMKGGAPKRPHATVCLETQADPAEYLTGGCLCGPEDPFFSTTFFEITHP